MKNLPKLVSIITTNHLKMGVKPTCEMYTKPYLRQCTILNITLVKRNPRHTHIHTINDKANSIIMYSFVDYTSAERLVQFV
jgi:hypothetical protein